MWNNHCHWATAQLQLINIIIIPLRFNLNVQVCVQCKIENDSSQSCNVSIKKIKFRGYLVFLSPSKQTQRLYLEQAMTTSLSRAMSYSMKYSNHLQTNHTENGKSSH
jgi:flagellar biosynthesis/type III secretory pathway ATPase